MIKEKSHIDIALLVIVILGISLLKITDSYYSNLIGDSTPAIALENDKNKAMVTAAAPLPDAFGSSPKVYTIDDLNSMDVKALEDLNGVGPAIAGRIEEYRAKHNGFKTLEELKNISGIGEKKYLGIMKQFQ